MILQKVNPFNPLKFYDDLLKGHLSDIYQEFRDHMYYSEESDSIEAYVTDGRTGDYLGEMTQNFKDYLSQELKKNNDDVLDFIYEKILLETNKKLIESFLNQINSDIIILIKRSLDSNLKESLVIRDFLQKLNKEINDKIWSYLKIGIYDQRNKKNQFKFNQEIPENPITTFTWTGSYVRQQIMTLWFRLYEHNFIQKGHTELDEFYKAFSGEIITNPLKIRWFDLIKNKKFSNKSSLLFLIDKLGENGLIRENDLSKNYEKIQMIFCEFNGDSLKNMKQAKLNYVKSGYENPIISEIIRQLLVLK